MKVFAINGLYTALGSPSRLHNWTTHGGDPCNEGWQGVECVFSNITAITLGGANLGGQLGKTLINFTTLIILDLSSNNITGTIPDGLPVTVQKLDFSSNNLTGPLPQSMGKLTALTSLHIQNNQISGTLNVLQDLPLQDLDIENNLFSGPVPVKLLNLPNFKKDGNPFNTSIAPSVQPPATSTPLPSPTTGLVPSKAPAYSPDSPEGNNLAPPSGKHKVSTIKLVGYIFIGVAVVVIGLMVTYCLSKYKERKTRGDIHRKGRMRKVPQKFGNPKIKEVKKIKESLPKLKSNVSKAASSFSSDTMEEQNLNLASAASSNMVYDAKGGKGFDSSTTAAPGIVTMEQKEHVIDIANADNFVEEQYPLQPVAQPAEKAIANHSGHIRRGRAPFDGKVELTTTIVKSFSIASLQQYTHSFSEENFIRESRFGKVYLAELPDGKLLEVLKIDSFNPKIPVDAFLEMVVTISELRHPNILGLVGYCVEYEEQRLLVYEHCGNMTLHGGLHCVDDSNKPLSWNARLHVAVGAAKALQHLHDCCQPPIVHQNFEPTVVLLNSTLAVHVSECGLAALASKSASQLSGRSLLYYKAPEVHESGSTSDRSDVYSFGVIMLELLTGRKPYDSSHPHAEQHLVRWASSQLYDIYAIKEMVDPSIQGQPSGRELSLFADIVCRCIQHEPQFRSPMSQVVEDLTRMLSM